MDINVIDLKIEKIRKITIDNDTDYVYGVETSQNIFCKDIGSLNIENAAILCLDSTNKIINYSRVAMGEINHVKVQISQIAKIALLSNASKVIIAHNHPSGVLEITSNDIELTQKIGYFLKLIDIELIDSLVVNEVQAKSVREEVGK